jgi:hypothetical protein
MTITLRGAFIGMLAVVLCIGLYLFWLWRTEHQVRLHTEHFFHAIDGRNWETVAEFIGDDYYDQWENDRTRLLERMREGFRWVTQSLACGFAQTLLPRQTMGRFAPASGVHR